MQCVMFFLGSENPLQIFTLFKKNGGGSIRVYDSLLI